MLKKGLKKIIEKIVSISFSNKRIRRYMVSVLYKYVCIDRASNYSDHPIYGKIYCPPYNHSVSIENKIPDIYNNEGYKMELFFLRDIHTAHSPYSYSKYFEWDRYNIGLKTHFYSHNSMLETMGKPVRRFGCLIEAESVVPEDYKIFEKHKGLEKDFDLIFTYSAKLLEKIPNAKFVPFVANVWYGVMGGTMRDDAYKQKSKNVSFLCSNKTFTEMHRYRHELAMYVKQNKLADTYGRFDGGGGRGMSQ